MILGKKTRLRAIERQDIPAFVRWLNDPEVTRFLTLYSPISTANEERWFEKQLDDSNAHVFAIETLESVHIGNVGLHNIDWKNRNALLGIFIGEKTHWGLGYGTDAVRAILSFAFSEMNLHCVYLDVFAFNKRAQRVYEKAGFALEGVQRQRLFHEGKYHDVLIMSILHSEFIQEKERSA